MRVCIVLVYIVQLSCQRHNLVDTSTKKISLFSAQNTLNELYRRFQMKKHKSATYIFTKTNSSATFYKFEYWFTFGFNRWYPA